MELKRKEVKPTEEELKESAEKLKTLEKIQEENRKVLNLKLHEHIYVSSISKDILRVQSGWIYSDWDNEKDCLKNSIFVIDTRD